jgi:DNA-binding LacI/PurR family transcriptional regulator
LVELGHRRFAFVAGPKHSLDSEQRLQGIEACLLSHKLKLPATNVVYGSNFAALEAENYARKWLKLPSARRPTAVLLACDLMALAFMRALQLAGISIPKEVSIGGFDDITAAGLYWPGLTTARQETRAMGAAACRALFENSDADAEARPRGAAAVEFPMELIVRESTGAAPNQ